MLLELSPIMVSFFICGIFQRVLEDKQVISFPLNLSGNVTDGRLVL